jgi:carbonic anhydrase
MMSVTDELLDNARRYAATFDKGHLPLPPAKHVAVVACMDARLNPYGLLGLSEGDAHVIRNAGGIITQDELRSLAISQRLLGTNEIVLIHHTDCGMLTFTNDIMRDLLSKSLETATIEDGQWRDVEPGEGATAGEYIEWLTIRDLAQSVVSDVTRIRTHPLVPNRIRIHGFVYDVTNGKLVEVPEATLAGEPAAQARAAKN